MLQECLQARTLLLLWPPGQDVQEQVGEKWDLRTPNQPTAVCGQRARRAREEGGSRSQRSQVRQRRARLSNQTPGGRAGRRRLPGEKHSSRALQQLHLQVNWIRSCPGVLLLTPAKSLLARAAAVPSDAGAPGADPLEATGILGRAPQKSRSTCHNTGGGAHQNSHQNSGDGRIQHSRVRTHRNWAQTTKILGLEPCGILLFILLPFTEVTHVWKIQSSPPTILLRANPPWVFSYPHISNMLGSFTISMGFPPSPDSQQRKTRIRPSSLT